MKASTLAIVAVAVLSCARQEASGTMVKTADQSRTGPGDAGTGLQIGASQNVSGSQIETWSRSGSDSKVSEVGITVPLAIFENPPANREGPAGAFVVLPFPDAVREQTFFNHVEMHWNPQGHPPAAFQVPHFDLHFYAIRPEQVREIKAADPVPADKIPPGYVDPGPIGFEPEMGTHLVDPQDLQRPFTLSMIVGVHGGNVIFVEPMITRAYLLEKHSKTIEVPQPPSFGRPTIFPKTLRMDWDGNQNAYRFVFTDFAPRQ